MGRRIGDVENEYGLEEEGDSLIELSTGGRRRASRQLGGSTTCSSLIRSNPTFRWSTVLILLAIVAGVHHLGVQEGRNVAEKEIDFNDFEDVEKKNLTGEEKISVGGDKQVSADTPPPTPRPTEGVPPTPRPTEGVPPTPRPTEEVPPTPRPTATSQTGPPPTPPPTIGNSTSWIPEPNAFVSKFNTTAWTDFLKKQWEERVKNSIDINDKYGIYCPKEPNTPMCPPLDEDGGILDKNQLNKGPTVKCIDTGGKEQRCGVGTPWLNKTIWPLLRGPFCAIQDENRRKQFPLPAELVPYSELGYNRADPTNSTDAAPFDGGSAPKDNNNNLLSFDPSKVKEHFLKFEAMLEHYYEGLARPLLERQLHPMPEDPLYARMLKAHSDQIARALLRANKGNAEEYSTMVIGVLGDSVTSGTDNCYYDSWPETLRRQLAPLFGAMGIKVETRNAAKNGGWSLAPQLLCANDMLGASDRPVDVGLDFLFVCNPFVKATAVDGEHFIRRALLGKSHTVVSITANGMSQEAMLTKYAAAGLTFGTPFQQAPPELGIPEKGYRYWFPNNDRAFWGMQGDGFCHLTTRAGSSAVVNRNWHWGPKMHQTYADAYALLFSRATRHAIDELSAGRMPPEPPKLNDVDGVLKEEESKAKDEKEGDQPPPTWRTFLSSDMGLEEAVSAGISGVRCAVGTANQAGSTLLSHWLRPAEGSPFEEKMKARNGESFVPSDHDAEGSKFYQVKSPISPPNGAVAVGDWVDDPSKARAFGAEAPRTGEQCRHVDGSTLATVKTMSNPDGFSWLVWEVPKGVVSIGRAIICHGSAKTLVEGAFDKGDIRSHYAVPEGKDGWKVFEDAHKSKPFGFVGEECMPVVPEMNEADLHAAREGGMWVAVEWKKEATAKLNPTYLVAM